jgi:hypothetical protein
MHFMEPRVSALEDAQQQLAGSLEVVPAESAKKAALVSGEIYPFIVWIANLIAHAFQPFLRKACDAIEGPLHEFINDVQNLSARITEAMKLENERNFRQLIRNLVDLEKAEVVQGQASFSAHVGAAAGVSASNAKSTKREGALSAGTPRNAAYRLRKILTGLFGRDDADIPPEASSDRATLRQRSFKRNIIFAMVIAVVAAIDWIAGFDIWKWGSSKLMALALNLVTVLGFIALTTVTVRKRKRYSTYRDAVSTFARTYPQGHPEGFAVEPLPSSERNAMWIGGSVLFLASAALLITRVLVGGTFQAIAGACAVLFTLIIYALAEYCWLAPEYNAAEYDLLRKCVLDAATEASTDSAKEEQRSAEEQQRAAEETAVFGSIFGDVSLSIGSFPDGVKPRPWLEYLREYKEIYRRAHNKLLAARERQRMLKSLLEQFHSGCQLTLRAYAQAVNEFLRVVARGHDPYNGPAGPRLLIRRSSKGDVYNDQPEATSNLITATLLEALFRIRGVEVPKQPTLGEAFVHYDFQQLQAIQRHHFHVDFPVFTINRFEVDAIVRRLTHVPAVSIHAEEPGKIFTFVDTNPTAGDSLQYKAAPDVYGNPQTYPPNGVGHIDATRSADGHTGFAI